MGNSVSAQIYDMTLAANGSRELLVSGTYYRIRTNTGNVSVRRDGGSVLGPLSTGQGEQDVQFNRLTITDLSGATNTVTIIVSDSHFVDAQLLGTVSIGNSPIVQIASADKLQLIRPEAYTAAYKSNTVMAANTADAIFAAGANVNGMILLDAGFSDIQSASGQSVLISKATAPASVIDGDVHLTISAGSVGTSLNFVAGKLTNPVRIPAGVGLYYIQNGTVTNSARFAKWIAL